MGILSRLRQGMRRNVLLEVLERYGFEKEAMKSLNMDELEELFDKASQLEERKREMLSEHGLEDYASSRPTVLERVIGVSEEHEEELPEEAGYRCPECGELIHSRRGFKSHVGRLHKDSKEEIFSELRKQFREGTKHNYWCRECCEGFNTYIGLREHLLKRH